MRFDNNKWVTNILRVVDTLNTLNGGIISPVFKLNEYDDYYELLAKVPGVSPHNLRIEVIENKLMVYHLMETRNIEQEVVPNILKVLPVPDEVDLHRISAQFEDKLLVVNMPFGQTDEHCYRSVDINVHN